MEPLKLPNSLLKRMEFHSETCEIHGIQKMTYQGQAVCPRCEVEEDTKKLERDITEEYYIQEQKRQYNIFYKQSIVSDQSVLEADIHKLTAQDGEDRKNLNTAFEVLKAYKKGNVFNLVFQGVQGVGKSYTSYALLRELNESRKLSCLYISVDEMVRLIKDSFSNKESRYTEQYFVDLCSRVDFLTLDDLGAETGAMDSGKRASDFIHRVLYGITNARQNKSTITTTNLRSEDLYNMYDKKIISRLFRKPKFIIYKETKDKRINQMPF
ncbi:ATP-binding protein [Rossellomorea marisflavi]|uniref:ATP-binding protein n=1 Tax=Rossellomorea marisflavi TaxID=189381 RepID=UPI00345DBDB7